MWFTMSIDENLPSKINFFFANFFSLILIAKIDVIMNLRIITKNHAGDSEIEFLTKSISKSYGRAMAMPIAWELTDNIRYILGFKPFSQRGWSSPGNRSRIFHRLENFRLRGTLHFGYSQNLARKYRLDLRKKCH